MRWFNNQKWLGFINDGVDDLFVHNSSVRFEGFRVSYRGKTSNPSLKLWVLD